MVFVVNLDSGTIMTRKFVVLEACLWFSFALT